MFPYGIEETYYNARLFIQTLMEAELKNSSLPTIHSRSLFAKQNLVNDNSVKHDFTDYFYKLIFDLLLMYINV